MTTLALNSLWNYIQSLSLSASNKKWLAERLLESNAANKTDASGELSEEDAELARLLDEERTKAPSMFGKLTVENDDDDYADIVSANAGRATALVAKWL